MKVNLKEMIAAIDDEETDVIFSEVDGLFIFITKSGKAANAIDEAINEKISTPTPASKKGAKESD